MFNWVIGDNTTEPLDFEFLEVVENEETPVDISGVTAIELRCKPLSGNTVISFDLDDLLSIVSAVLGQVRLSPEAASFLLADKGYFCYFRVTDSGGKIIRFPSDHNFELVLIEDF